MFGVNSAVKKINRVIEGFQGMVDDLNAGIESLKQAIRSNEDEISLLEQKNGEHQIDISRAISIREKLLEIIP